MGGGFFFFLYISYARRHPTPHLFISVLTPERSPSGSRQYCLASGHRLRTVPDAADAQVGSAIGPDCWHDGAHGDTGSTRLYPTVTQVLRWFGYRGRLVGVTIFYIG